MTEFLSVQKDSTLRELVRLNFKFSRTARTNEAIVAGIDLQERRV
jgi:hypothetical protein